MTNYLILGGTGTLGHVLAKMLLQDDYFCKIRIFARDEYKLNAMRDEFEEFTSNMDYLQGDIRDEERVVAATRDVDCVYHLAAIKTVDGAERNPVEAVKTNILGTINVVKACHKWRVNRAVFTSTDKACSPITHYGSTKQCAENIFINGNQGKKAGRCKFSVVRYGNVVGSRGSVFERWDNQKILRVTNLEMTRFYWSKNDAARFCMFAMGNMDGGETFVPHLKSCTNYQLIEAFNKPYKVIGLRCSEKLHEDLISSNEATSTHYWREHDVFVKYPIVTQYPIDKFGEKVPDNFSFNSFNTTRLTTLEIKKLLIDSGYAKELEVKEWIKSRCA
jgi:UDP-N-acetylglucosamine 4,6-dehydratase/5-epimerase